MGLPAAIADLQLFARKGEAMPADVKPTRFRPEPRPKRVERAAVGDPCADAEDDNDWEASTLCGLIQRRVLTDDPIAARARSLPPDNRSRRPEGGSETRTVEMGKPHPREVPAPSVVVCDGATPEPSWRKMTVRLPPDRYRELQEVARLWGTSYQTLLRQAVNRFLDDAINGRRQDVSRDVSH